MVPAPVHFDASRRFLWRAAPAHRACASVSTLPGPLEPFAAYVEAAETGNLLFPTRMLPDGGPPAEFIGPIDSDLDVEAGKQGSSPRGAERPHCRAAAFGIRRQARTRLGCARSCRSPSRAATAVVGRRVDRRRASQAIRLTRRSIQSGTAHAWDSPHQIQDVAQHLQRRHIGRKSTYRSRR
jgi:hypothetical protein